VAELEGRTVALVEDAERVLDGGDVGEVERLRDDLGGDRGDADQVELAFLAQLAEGAETLAERTLGLGVHQPQVDEVEALDPQGAEVLLDPLAQLRGRERRQPGTPLVAAGADLGHQPQALGIGMEGVADQLVDDVGAVVLGGVDVVDAELDRAPEDGARRLGVARRAEDAGAGELHRAEANPVDGLVS